MQRYVTPHVTLLFFYKEILLNESQSMATETLAEGRPAKP